MIIWNGLGFLVLVFAFGCSLAMNLVTNSLFRDESYYTTRGWPLELALIAAGALTWVVGRALNRRRGKAMIEKETGREVLVLPKHALFFIKMHYWGPMLIALGLAALFLR